MTTRTNSSAAILQGTLVPVLRRVTNEKPASSILPLVRTITRDYFSWDQLATRHPLVHLLQPDYYKVFRLANPEAPVYQQNLHLDLGSVEVTHIALRQFVNHCDAAHLQRTDKIIHQFALECHLGSFDFISSIIIRWNGPGNDQRYLLRKTAILQTDDHGVPAFGIMTLKDITPLVSSLKPDNIDITFHPERSDLRCELMRRIKLAQPKSQSHFTAREVEIIRCLSKGMSSKEIASELFISKATVDTHRQNLIHKWEVTNTAALLRKAMEVGCI